jgi:RNase H-like domain found in reverse transcriptase
MNFLGINIQFSDGTVHWEHARSMPFKPVDAMIDTDYHIAESMAVEDTTEQIRKILDAKYQATDLKKVCSAQSHLQYQQQRKLFDLLNKFSHLFDGTLGKWNQDPIKLELKEGATPYHAQPFPIPKCHAETLKMEVERLVEIGVLKKVNRSEWAAPSFIIPKKDGTVWFINDFRELNNWITQDGIKPLPDKVKAILAIDAPQNRRELRSFIGIINYYRDMWVRRSHVLAPLACLTSNKAKWSWGQQQEVAFQTAKKIIAREVMLAYPDFSKPFEIHTDANHYQSLGAVIS